jgi:hypothetical protein
LDRYCACSDSASVVAVQEVRGRILMYEESLLNDIYRNGLRCVCKNDKMRKVRSTVKTCYIHVAPITRCPQKNQTHTNESTSAF